MGYIFTAWMQEQIVFIHTPGKVNAARNIKEETLGHVTYIYYNLPSNQGSPQKRQFNM